MTSASRGIPSSPCDATVTRSPRLTLAPAFTAHRFRPQFQLARFFGILGNQPRLAPRFFGEALAPRIRYPDLDGAEPRFAQGARCLFTPSAMVINRSSVTLPMG